MATLQELSAKKQALIASGVSPNDAMGQAVKAPQNNIGGLSQTQASGIQDIYKANIAKGMNAAEAKAAIQADPAFAQAKAQYQQAPVTQTQNNAPSQPVFEPQAMVVPKTPQQAPIEQPMPVSDTPTTMPKQEKTVSPDLVAIKQNADDNRKREILASLSEGFTNDPEINKAVTTGDYETYKTRYEYDTADENKKRTLDAYFQAKQPKDSDGIYQILKTGARIASQNIINSPDYAKAKAKADIYNKLSGMSSNQLLTEMKNGNIGSDMDKELAASPEYAIAKQQYNSWKTIDDINKNTQNALGVINNKAKTEDNTLQRMSDKATANVAPDKLPSLQDYMKEKAPELATTVASFNQKNQQLRELSDERDNMLRTVIKDHPGISKGAAMVLAARNNESLNDQIKSMAYDLQTMQADINYATEIVKADFENAQKQQESSQAFERQKELARFQQELGLETNQAEFEQKIKQQAQLASDPYTAISTVMDEYKKLGIPFTQSVATKVNDANAFIKAGGTIGGYVDKMIKDIQAKDEYKAIQEKTQNTGKFSLGFDPITGSPYVLNQQTGTISSGGGGGMTSTGGGTATTTPTITNTIDYIKSKEGFREQAYKDSGGVWTVGYGFTNIGGKPVKEGDSIDQQSADELLQKKVGEYQNFANKITVPLTDAQKTALTSFEYNLGKNIWDGTAKPIIDKINSGDFTGAAEYMKKFNTVKGTVVKGLTNRRNEEASLLTQTEQPSPTTEQFTPSKKLAFDSYTEAANKGTVSTKDVINLAVTNGYPSAKAFLDDYNAYKNTPITQNGLTAGGFDSNQTEVYKRINTGKKITPDEAKSLGKTLAQLNAEAVAYGKSKDMDGVPAVNDLISTLNELKNVSKIQRVASQIPGSGIASGDISKFLANYNNIIAKTSLQNLIDLKNDGATFGALSNQELSFIKDASDTGKLRYDLSDKEWSATVDKLIANANKVKTNIVGNQSTPTQGGRVMTTTGGRIK